VGLLPLLAFLSVRRVGFLASQVSWLCCCFLLVLLFPDDWYATFFSSSIKFFFDCRFLCCPPKSFYSLREVHLRLVVFFFPQVLNFQNAIYLIFFFADFLFELPRLVSISSASWEFFPILFHVATVHCLRYHRFLCGTVSRHSILSPPVSVTPLFSPAASLRSRRVASLLSFFLASFS